MLFVWPFQSAVCGIHPHPTSYLAPYQVHNTKLHTVTILSNACILPFYASRYTLCVDSLQARPSVVGSEAGTAKHAPLIRTRIIVGILPTSCYFVLWSSTRTVNTCAQSTGRLTAFSALYSCSVQYARNIMRLFLDKAHARGAYMICYPYVPGTMTFGFSEKRVLVPQAVCALGFSQSW